MSLDQEYEKLKKEHQHPTSLLNEVRARMNEAKRKLLWNDYTFWLSKYTILHEIVVSSNYLS